MKNDTVQKYIRRVSRRMPVGGIHKRQFLAAMQEDVSCFLQENPRAGIAQLDAHFGSPDDIAADFIAQMPYRQINNKFRSRNRVVAIVTAVAVFIVISWVATLLYVVDKDNAADKGYTVISDIMQRK